jgi:hypothetical protein
MPYRVLSLDGGGAWALIEVRALIDLYGEGATGHQVLTDFDLVAANSGGSLVLGGLVENLSLGDLRSYFEDAAKRRAVFAPRRSFGDRILRDVTGLGPKYDAEAKLHAIERLMPACGNLPLAAAAAGIRRAGAAEDVRLVIVAYDYDRNRGRFFRSASSGRAGWGTGARTDVTLAEAIHASTNAAVNYFDAPATFHSGPGRFWDGGITGNNNPVVVAVTEALVIGQAPADIVALSLGTGTIQLPWPRDPRNPGKYETPLPQPSLANDLRKLATAILDDPPDAASFIAHVMTGAGAGLPAGLESRVVRMNPLVRPEPDRAFGWKPPPDLTAAQFNYLVNLDMDAVEPVQVDAIRQLADLWLAGKVRNQPIRIDGDTLATELGHDLYAPAKAAWLKLR